LPQPFEKSRRLYPGDFPVVPLAVGVADSLARFSDRLEFFTLAPLYLKGRFGDGLLADFLAEYGEEVVFYVRRFRHPVLRVPGPPDAAAYWGHTLWALRKEHWPAFETHLLALRLTDTPQRRLYGVGVQDLMVVDPLSVDRAGLAVYPPRYACVRSFGVNGSRSAWAFRTDPSAPWLPPELVRFPPDASIVKFADRLFRGEVKKAVDANPYEED
jgi:hypothetical protein